MLGFSYSPIPLLIFGGHPSFLKYNALDNSEIFSLIPEWAVPFIQFSTLGGFSLLIAGVTYRFWRRK
jgi:hypothetical protein